MNSRDDDLTFENVDERIEQLMREGKQTGAPAPLAGLAHTVRDLQRVYDEERRLEQGWAKIRSRAQSLESTAVSKRTENRESFQGGQKTMRDTPFTNPGSFQQMPGGSFQRKNSRRRRSLLTVGMGLAAAVVLIAVFAWLVSPMLHGTQPGMGSGGTPTTSTPTPQPTVSSNCSAMPTPAVTPSIPPTPQATSTPCPATPQATSRATPTPASSPVTVTPQPQSWKTYTATAFTLRYPANWVVNVVPQGSGGSYVEQIEFRPSATSAISFTVSLLYNGEMSPDTLLQNDTLYKDCTIESQSKVTVAGILWSTATGKTKGTQLAPARVTIAYANHKHPYRILFSAPPAQFATYSQTFNTMFQSFQER
ncbi:MAG TPA: hypothetical protein VF458_16445 [Ktedonobacteraceae bacterium]